MSRCVWRQCEGCGQLFRAPKWRSHCFFCGGDDEMSIWPTIAVVAAFDIVMLLVWRFCV